MKNLQHIYINEDEVDFGRYEWTTNNRVFRRTHIKRCKDITVCDYCINHRCFDAKPSFKRWGGKSWKLYRKTQWKPK